jgi:hypothetical protein
VKKLFFLENYDKIVKAVDERYDVRGSDLSNLVMMCLAQNGTVSKHRRKQFKYSVQEEVFDYIEQVTQTLLMAQEEEKQRVEGATE